MFDKLKQLKDLRDQAKQLQQALGEMRITETSKDQTVSVTLDGNMKILELHIDTPDKNEELKTLLNTAIGQAQRKAAEYMRSTGGFNIPGLS